MTTSVTVGGVVLVEVGATVVAGAASAVVTLTGAVVVVTATDVVVEGVGESSASLVAPPHATKSVKRQIAGVVERIPVSRANFMW